MSFFKRKTENKPSASSSQLVKITVTNTDGTIHMVEIPMDPNENLMHVLKEQDFDVPGACGGLASCGTCHIGILAGEVPVEVGEDEEFMLDGLPNVQENSRLSCQIPVVAELDGLKIQILGDE